MSWFENPVSHFLHPNSLLLKDHLEQFGSDRIPEVHQAQTMHSFQPADKPAWNLSVLPHQGTPSCAHVVYSWCISWLKAGRFRRCHPKLFTKAPSAHAGAWIHPVSTTQKITSCGKVSGFGMPLRGVKQSWALGQQSWQDSIPLKQNWSPIAGHRWNDPESGWSCSTKVERNMFARLS